MPSGNKLSPRYAPEAPINIHETPIINTINIANMTRVAARRYSQLVAAATKTVGMLQKKPIMPQKIDKPETYAHHPVSIATITGLNAPVAMLPK